MCGSVPGPLDGTYWKIGAVSSLGFQRRLPCLLELLDPMRPTLSRDSWEPPLQAPSSRCQVR